MSFGLNLPGPFLRWAVAALLSLTFVAALIIRAELRNSPTRWNSFLVGDPHEGALLFFERKGCAQCHSANGVGGNSAPDLGFNQSSQSSLSQIVSGMWNHAPAMWESMHEKRIAQPYLDREDMANLFAFLYTTRYMDEPGDSRRGEHLFTARGCVRCHGVEGAAAGLGPDLSRVAGVDTPIVWAQIMWNHAPKMEVRMQQVGVPWPKFQDREMNDLLAYVREVVHGERSEAGLLPADPRRGWKVFQDKSCTVCHAVNGKGGRVGPDLGQRRLPGSIVQLAGVMWNHSPEMWRASESQGIPRPKFDGRQLADLAAFLASFQYFEPEGSPDVGAAVFSERGCAGCHGSHGEGTRQAPPLRAAGNSFTLVALATALWSDGPRMYRRTRELGVPWPTINESEVGDVVAFLNTPSGGGR
jgi:mono/diheme cytochrome c family protein